MVVLKICAWPVVFLKSAKMYEDFYDVVCLGSIMGD